MPPELRGAWSNVGVGGRGVAWARAPKRKLAQHGAIAYKRSSQWQWGLPARRMARKPPEKFSELITPTETICVGGIFLCSTTS
jgi:hypothetical protein